MSTSLPTVTATTTNTARATTFSAWVIVNVWNGSTKNQLTSSEAPTAATIATIHPPIAAMISTRVKNVNSTVDSSSRSRHVVRIAVRSGRPMTVSAAAITIRAGSSVVRRRRPSVGVLRRRAGGDHVDIDALTATGQAGDERAVERARSAGCVGSPR